MAWPDKQKAAELRRRRATVSDLYIQGYPQIKIAEQLGISQTTVCHDLKRVQKQWVESGIRNFDVLRERELKKIERVEHEAWLAWQRSQKAAQSATMTTTGSEQKTQKKVEDQVGDPRFLEQVLKCGAARRALLGLDQPTKIAPTSPDGEEAYHSHVMSELMRLAEQSKDGPEVIDADFISNVVEQQAIEHQPDEQTLDPTEGNGQHG